MLALDAEDRPDLAERMDELALLAESAGAEVVARVIQRRPQPDPAMFVGRGKAEELDRLCTDLKANLVVTLQDLRPVQERNLSELLNRKVIDRQALILDIFARRARTKEGRLQVELAQLNYLLPRLTGYGIMLSRLGGGIGTRGPGETKLESDRRHIHRRITLLRREVEHLRAHRERLRASRHHKGFALAALVGYTNAGKSTLMNALTGAGVLVEDKLFATLDPTSRKVSLSDGRAVLLVDTVGFIRDLPHDLAAAFKATLEEVEDADILVHVADASHPQVRHHMETVSGVLEEMGVDQKPIIHVLNKVDALEEPGDLDDLRRDVPEAVTVSGLKGTGLRILKERLRVAVPRAHPTAGRRKVVS